MATAKGTFEVLSGSESTYQDADGEARLAHAGGGQRFDGGIEGDGRIEWLMCYLPAGGARLVGLQRIEGSIDGRRGSVVIEAFGDHDGKASTASWRIVPGSGTGDLAGIGGDGGFEAPGGRTVSYHLEYEIA